MTMMMKLTGRRQVELTQSLLRADADARQADSAGHTPLHVAVRARRPDLIRELVVHGRANINGRDAAGMTAIHLAAVYDASGTSD